MPAPELKHPIASSHKEIEAWLYGAWQRVTYLGWEEIVEDDHRHPKKGGNHRVVYNVAYNGRMLDGVHQTRVRPIQKPKEPNTIYKGL
jgi:hypothetical protein